MSILNKVDDIKIGQKNAKYVYLGDVYIWPTGEAFWTFDQIPSSLSMRVRLSSNIYNSMIFWEDSIYDRASDGEEKFHTYT